MQTEAIKSANIFYFVQDLLTKKRGDHLTKKHISTVVEYKEKTDALVFCCLDILAGILITSNNATQQSLNNVVL